MTYKQINFVESRDIQDRWMVEVPVKPCPWCRKTPNFWAPLDNPPLPQYKGPPDEDATWIWELSCSCKVKSKASVSIRKTNKTNIARFLDKLDELFDKWNSGNPFAAYEKKIVNLREVPTLRLA